MTMFKLEHRRCLAMHTLPPMIGSMVLALLTCESCLERVPAARAHQRSMRSPTQQLCRYAVQSMNIIDLMAIAACRHIPVQDIALSSSYVLARILLKLDEEDTCGVGRALLLQRGTCAAIPVLKTLRLQFQFISGAPESEIWMLYVCCCSSTRLPAATKPQLC